MNKIKLDIQKQDELIKSIQEFVLKETDVKFSKEQASELLNSILNNIECIIYSQISAETRYNMMLKIREILGIERPPLH